MSPFPKALLQELMDSPFWPRQESMQVRIVAQMACRKHSLLQKLTA